MPGSVPSGPGALVAALAGIELTYPGPPPVTAIQGCDLQLAKGDFVAIMGASGSGKSSLLNVIGLLEEPTAGSYILNGMDVAHLSDTERAAVRARHLGFVFQSFHLIPHRTATENVELGLLYSQTRRKHRPAIAHEALGMVGLTHRLDAMPATLSGGERQRVAIARALATEPALLLCDEPTGNLDSATTDSVLDLLDQLHDHGVTIVVITHEDHVARRAQRIVRMQDGLLTETAAC